MPPSRKKPDKPEKKGKGKRGTKGKRSEAAAESEEAAESDSLLDQAGIDDTLMSQLAGGDGGTFAATETPGHPAGDYAGADPALAAVASASRGEYQQAMLVAPRFCFSLPCSL